MAGTNRTIMAECKPERGEFTSESEGVEMVNTDNHFEGFC